MQYNSISIIIPTYNRADILEKTLESIKSADFNQKNLEIIVVDDGSIDNTKNIIKNFDVLYFYQKNNGQASARNKGIKKAKNDIIIFIGDDIILKKDFLSEHLKFHNKYKENNFAILGYTNWHRDIEKNKFNNFLINGGPQFDYRKLRHNTKTNFWHFYTSNISLKRELIQNEVFPEIYKTYGWEDIEFGFSLYKKYNLKIVYNRNAIGYHLHKINFNSLKQRMISIGKNGYIFQTRHKDINLQPRGLKKIIFIIFSHNFFLFLFKNLHLKKLYYYFYAKKYFLYGFNLQKSNFNDKIM